MPKFDFSAYFWYTLYMSLFTYILKRSGLMTTLANATLTKKVLAAILALFMTGCSSVSDTSTDTVVIPSETAVVTTTNAPEIPSETASTSMAETTVATSVAESITETEAILTELASTATSVEEQPETSAVTTKQETESTTAEITTSAVTEAEPKELASKVLLDVKNIQQMPELPAGCEITSATIALNYLGFSVDKMSMIDYMDIMEEPDENGNWCTPWYAFVGHPSTTRYGAYSPVIKRAVESYFDDNGIEGYEVVDLKDSSMTELYRELNDGYPVVVWATMNMVKSKYTRTWKDENGQDYTWLANEHCLVLIGYDLEQGTVTLSDPWDERGTVTYSEDLFEKRYTELFQQALVIRPTE